MGALRAELGRVHPGKGSGSSTYDAWPLIELVVAFIAYCSSHLPWPRRTLRSWDGAYAGQKGMNIFLSYPASCVHEVVHDSQIVALYVARLA